MSFISYAQNYEDVMLFRALRGVEAGFYIDVGAQDPVEDSVTKAFYAMGWRGINVEPVTYWFERLVADRPHDINLQLAVSDSPGELHLFEVVDSGLSTTSPDFATLHAQEGHDIRESDVKCVTLDEICATHRIEEVHFLKIDCEGCEAAALRGISLEQVRPWVILLEATEPNSQVPAYMEWESLLTDRGYHFVYEDGLNRFYVADEHAELDAAFSHPPNVFDYFVRASEATARDQLESARNDLRTLLEAQRVIRAESECERLRVSVEHLQGENERREEALVEHRRLLNEAIEREAQNVARMQADAERWRANAEYLREENERREGALVEHRRLLRDATEHEERSIAHERAQAGQWRDLSEQLREKNSILERRLSEQHQTIAMIEATLAMSPDDLAPSAERSAVDEEELENRVPDLSLLRARLAAWSDEVRGLRSEIARLHHEVALRDNEVGRLHAFIQMFHRSFSWRITLPLRLAKRGARASMVMLGRILYHLLRWPGHFVRPLLRLLARWQWLRSLAVRVAGVDSTLATHTRLFLFGKMPEVEPHQEPGDAGKSEHLSERALQVLAEIQDVRKSDHAANGWS